MQLLPRKVQVLLLAALRCCSQLRRTRAAWICACSTSAAFSQQSGLATSLWQKSSQAKGLLRIAASRKPGARRTESPPQATSLPHFESSRVAKILRCSSTRSANHSSAVVEQAFSPAFGPRYDFCHGSIRPAVPVQREMERERSPLARIPPLRGGDFQGMRVYRSDVVLGRARKANFRAPQHRLDEPARLSLGMVASLQSPLPFHPARPL
jgi:hypothetical protein